MCRGEVINAPVKKNELIQVEGKEKDMEEDLK
jgi:hypothetical protein